MRLSASARAGIDDANSSSASQWERWHFKVPSAPAEAISFMTVWDGRTGIHGCD